MGCYARSLRAFGADLSMIFLILSYNCFGRERGSRLSYAMHKVPSSYVLKASVALSSVTTKY